MAEYIKREDAIEAMYKVSDKCVWIPFWNEQLLALEALPAEDVQPVKHGKWVQDEHTYSGHWTYNFVCSACGELGGTWIRNIRRDQMFQYCPFCGARMDMEDNCDD